MSLSTPRMIIGMMVMSASLAHNTIDAQSTYDGDLTTVRQWQLAVDAMTYPAPSAKGGWVWLNPRAYLGVSKTLEFGAGASIYTNPSGGASAFQPSVKWRAFRDTTRHLTLSAGGQSLVGLSRATDTYGLTFATLESWLNHSERAAGAISVGRYALVGRDRESTDDRQGTIVTAWEAVGPYRLSGSWITGQNFYGYRTATLTYTTATMRWFGIGYSQGNAAWHNAGPYISTGRIF